MSKENGKWIYRSIGLAILLASIIGTWYVNDYRIDCIEKVAEANTGKIDDAKNERVGMGKDIEYISKTVGQIWKKLDGGN